MHLRLRTVFALLAVAVMVSALPLTAGLFAAEGSFDRTLKVTGAVDLSVETGSGSISVRAGEAGRVRVTATIKARSGWGISSKEAEEKVRQLEANPPIEQTGNIIRIGRIEDRELRRNVSISYEVVAPRETRLNSDSGSGSQTIEGLHGPVKAETGSGSITMAEIGDEVRAETGSGSIELDSVNGRVYAHTGSGSIRGTGIAGGVFAGTGSGSVRLELTVPGSVEVETGSGGVEVSGVRGSLRVETGSGSVTASGEPRGDWKLSTGSGGITLQLPAEVAFDLDASTSSGRIYTDHPITVQGSFGGRELRGKVRGGGVLIALRTGSGSIRIE